MPSRVRKPALTALTFVLGVLLCLAGTASGVAITSPEKTASGDFFGVEPFGTGETVEQTLQPRRGEAASATELASGRRCWLSPDPIEEEDSLNLYEYAGNDPVNSFDPLGLQTTDSVTAQAAQGNTFASNFLRECARSSAKAAAQRAAHKRLANNVLDAVKSKLGRLKSDPLNRRHLNAARKELQGQVVARKSNGDPFDHVTEVRNALRSLNNTSRTLKELAKDSRCSSETRSKLLDAARHIDKQMQHVQRMVPGI